ncbi:MAG: hypothetical protein KDG89_13290 [Geminicoccaceae bacterium]|nr:hypothetical protein [Geminicoccaceae bacterium]
MKNGKVDGLVTKGEPQIAQRIVFVAGTLPKALDDPSIGFIGSLLHRTDNRYANGLWKPQVEAPEQGHLACVTLAVLKPVRHVPSPFIESVGMTLR